MNIMQDKEQTTKEKLKAYELLAKACGDFLERPKQEQQKTIIVKWQA